MGSVAATGASGGEAVEAKAQGDGGLPGLKELELCNDEGEILEKMSILLVGSSCESKGWGWGQLRCGMSLCEVQSSMIWIEYSHSVKFHPSSVSLL